MEFNFNLNELFKPDNEGIAIIDAKYFKAIAKNNKEEVDVLGRPK